MIGVGVLGLAVAWWWGWGTERPAIAASEALVRVQAPGGLAEAGEADSLRQSLRESIARLEARPEKSLGFGEDTVSAADVAGQLRQVAAWLDEGAGGQELLARLASRYRCYRSAAGDGGVLFTGYYEAELRGDRVRQGAYQTPLYRLPEGVVQVDLGLFGEEWAGRRLSGRVQGGKLLPLPGRAEIARGALAGSELLWVEDPVEAFFLEIQGSGRILLPDGNILRVGYAGANGHPYKAIGSLLIQEGKIPKAQMSRRSLQAYLRAHPEEQRRVFDFNPSTVFFEIRERGPVGSTGAIVTAGRSIATDSKLFPPGALALIVTTLPIVDEAGERLGEQPLVRLVLNQDTGGAIQGPGRADLFLGAGEAAARVAGQLKDRGTLYFFSPLAP